MGGRESLGELVHVGPYQWMQNRRYHRARRLALQSGFEELFIPGWLSSESRVIDAGAACGDVSRSIIEVAHCSSIGFEPGQEFQASLRRLTTADSRFETRIEALWDEDGIGVLSGTGISGQVTDRHSSNTYSMESAQVKLTDIAHVVLSEGPFDMIKMNVEGAEYRLLLRLASQRLISAIPAYLIQFHRTRGFRSEYSAVVRCLDATHQCLWRWPYLWELWVAKSRAPQTQLIRLPARPQ